MYHQILAQLFRSLRTWLVNSIKSCTKSEPYKTTLCRVLALVMFAAPLLVHAEPLVRRTDGVLAKAEALGALGDKWRTKAIPANSATGLKAKSNEAISIDEWMAENNLEPAAAPITPAFLTLNSTSIYCVYGGLTGNTTQFGEINVATGTLTPIFTTSTVGGSAALGIDATSVTPTLYYADRTTTDNQLRRYDGTTESGSLGTFTGSNPALPLLRMGFAGGTGYAIDNGNNLFSFTPSAPSTIISKGVIAFQGTSPTGTTSSGDIAFDGFGRGWAIFGNSLYRLNFNAFPVKAYPIGQVTVGGVGLVVLDGTNTGNLIGSIAFDNAGDLYLANTVYAGTAQYTKILKVSVNDATATQVGANLPNSIPDLASGNAPLLAPAIVATKSVSPTGNVKPGDILTYTIDVQNNGNAPAVVLTFTDAIPAGTTYVANSATLNGTSLAAAAYPFNTAYTINGRTASSGSIKSGNVNRATVTYQVTVNTTSPPVSVVNGAVINYLDGPGSGVTSTTTTSSVVSPVDGYKSVQLTTDPDGSGTITEGDTVTWTVFYKNTTASAISSVQINDKLPVGVTIAATGGQTVTVSGTGTTATKNTAYTGAATGTVSNLLAASAALGTSGVITVSIPVTINIGFTGDISNQATATGSSIPAAGTLTDNVDSTTTGLPTGVTVPAGSVVQTATAAIDPTTLTVSPPSSNLKLTKSAPAQAQANSPLTYTLTVSNIGRLATSGTTTVSDSLPTGITVNSGAAGTVTTSGAQAANWTCASDSASPQTITCDSTTAIAATSGTSVFAFSVDVGSTVTTNIINQAKVWGGGDPSKPAVTTTGTISACTLASENTAGSAANAGCAYESTPVVNVPGYKSVKLTTDIDSSGSITPGDTLTYTLQYANTGTIAVPAFQINDQIPSGFIISATGGQTVTVTGAGTTVTKNASYTGAAAGAVSDLLAASAVIAPGGVITITIPVTIATGATGTKSNQASATGTDLSTAVLSDNAGATADLPASVTAAPYNLTLPASSVAQTITATLDPTTLTIAGLPMIALVKSVTPTGDQPPGADLTYKIVFSNTGGAAAQKLIIFDPIPNNTDFKLGSETITPGTTGLTIMVEFSNDFVAATPTLATWTYVPASGGGGAPTGYDRNVKAVRWRVTAGNLSQIPPNHTGDAGFTVKIR